MRIAVPGGELHCTEAGSGPPLLLLHGLGGPATFDLVVPLLARTHRVLVPDLAGFGASTRRGPASVAAWAQDTAALLAAVDAVPASVVGQSLGGMVAQVLAAREAGSVRRLVLANTFVDSAPDRVAGLHQRAAAARSQGMPALADSLAPAAFAHRQPPPPDAVRIYADATRAIDPEGFAQACEALAAASTRDLLAAITCPTLVISGSADRASPPEMAAALLAGIAGSTAAVLEGCGHLSPLEEPRRFAELVQRFVA